MILITGKERNKLCAMEEITAKTVRDLFQNYSSGKIKKPKIGKLSIVNAYIPDFKEKKCDSELLKVEGHYVFYALEKLSFGLFSNSTYRMFIWEPLSNEIFAVPVESVTFEDPIKDDDEIFCKDTYRVSFLKEEVLIASKMSGGKKHDCWQEGIELTRRFSIEKDKIKAIRDTLIHHLRWTDPDWWVTEKFTVEEIRSPMYYLRHEIERIPSDSIRISYPIRTSRGEICE